MFPTYLLQSFLHEKAMNLRTFQNLNKYLDNRISLQIQEIYFVQSAYNHNLYVIIHVCFLQLNILT